MTTALQRVSGGWRRFAVERFARRDFALPGNVAYVSFTFDDFPLTAWTEGGRQLVAHGARGTYFVSFQLLDRDSISGRIASVRDLQTLLSEGHELGCHTFSHLDGSVVTAAEFERSIERNGAALADSGLDARFDVFAYPLNGPAVATKRAAGRRFSGCRAGGQTFNHGVIDLSLLKAYFLDGRTRGRMKEIADLIEQNAAARGWLIFATHDVGARPSEYGCDAGEFEQIVRLSVDSGARVLPMTRVCAELGISPCSS